MSNKSSLLTLSCALLLATMPLSAKCAYRAHWAWPATESLPENGLIVLEAYGDSREFAEGLAQGDVLLECGGPEPVALHPLQMLRGEMQISQVLLAADGPLPTGATCTVWIPKLDGDKPSVYAQSWRIEGALKKLVGSWTGTPEVAEKRYDRYGCGPQVEVDFTIPTASKQAVFALAEVEEAAGPTKQRRSYLLPIEDGRISVGHSMCSGPFRLKPGVEYHLWITAMNAAGFAAAPRTGPIAFEAPVPSSFGR